jgi:hypothetical protein
MTGGYCESSAAAGIFAKMSFHNRHSHLLLISKGNAMKCMYVHVYVCIILWQSSVVVCV